MRPVLVVDSKAVASGSKGKQKGGKDMGMCLILDRFDLRANAFEKSKWFFVVVFRWCSFV